MQPWPHWSDPTAAPLPAAAPRPPGRPAPAEALARLRTGNFRYALGSGRPHLPAGGDDLRPYAVVVGCLDARVPVDTLFEQGMGAICVVRSAGHVLDRAILGSVEFAVTELKVSLVVVLGHQDCRTIAAAVEAVRTGRRPVGARRFLIDEIIPAVLQAGPADGDLDRVTRVHLRRTVDRLRQTGSLADALTARRIDIIAAVYRLDNGHVEVL